MPTWPWRSPGPCPLNIYEATPRRRTTGLPPLTLDHPLRQRRIKVVGMTGKPPHQFGDEGAANGNVSSRHERPHLFGRLHYCCCSSIWQSLGGKLVSIIQASSVLKC